MRSLPQLATFTLALTLGCTSPAAPTPDQVRNGAAKATSTIVSDTKAAAEGIRDGLHRDTKPNASAININTAPRASLEVLPGITPALATRITAHRPYPTPVDLVKRRVLTADQYDAISAQITTGH